MKRTKNGGGETGKFRDDVDKFVSDFSRFYILTILYEGPVHGYKIMRRFKKRLKKNVSPSLVYPFLQKLEGRGYVEHEIQPVGEKERKVFKLTTSGKALCERLFERFANLVTTAIEPTLSSCAQCGCKIYEGGHQETIDGEELMFCCVHCAHFYKEEKKRRAN
ncbi:MAG: PadR family transcriptional regulator [Promethearchaeota archaeon]